MNLVCCFFSLNLKFGYLPKHYINFLLSGGFDDAIQLAAKLALNRPPHQHAGLVFEKVAQEVRKRVQQAGEAVDAAFAVLEAKHHEEEEKSHQKKPEELEQEDAHNGPRPSFEKALLDAVPDKFYSIDIKVFPRKRGFLERLYFPRETDEYVRSVLTSDNVDSGDDIHDALTSRIGIIWDNIKFMAKEASTDALRQGIASFMRFVMTDPALRETASRMMQTEVSESLHRSGVSMDGSHRVALEVDVDLRV